MAEPPAPTPFDDADLARWNEEFEHLAPAETLRIVTGRFDDKAVLTMSFQHEGVVIAHPLTRQELADLTGTTLYTVSRTLSTWQSDGVLETSSRRLIIRSPDKLAALAGPSD